MDSTATARALFAQVASAASACLRAPGALIARARRRRFGIVAHVACAFVVVAAFAVAANLFAMHGTVFITHVPPPAERLVYVQVPAPQPTPQPPPVSLPPETPMPLDTTRISAAAADLERATLHRMNRDGDAARLEFAAAEGRLRTAVAGFRKAAAPRAPDRSLAELERAADALAQAAMDVQSLADTQRHLSAEYRRHFDAMELRMSGSLEKAWKIFGRVIARESLVELDRSLGEIRRHVGELDKGQSARDSASALAHAESSFRASLEARASSLADSQGEAWVAGMRGDLDRLVAARTGLENGRRELEAGVQDVGARRAALVELAMSIAKTAAVPVARRTEPPRPADKPEPAGAGLRDIEIAAPTPVHQPIAAGAVPVTRVVTDREPAASRPLAWTSVAVLMLLLAISTLMALRVIRPVRELVAATRRLARGQLDTRVTGGGIQELDDLGSSFNEMAQHLADARAVAQDYQKLLETRVMERTRQLQHLAEHDPLTELPNRRQLFSQLAEALRAAEIRGDVVGVMILDLDNFKNINDTMGHAYGDRVLQGVAQRLEAVIAECGFSARQGGDEFTIVCRSARDVEEVTETAERILKAFQEPLDVAGGDISVSMSLGIAAFPSHARNSDELLRAADAALFRAKALGRHRYSVFTPDLLDDAASRFRTEQGLRQAIERGEFELAFQPEVAADTFDVPLVEALLRWRLPDGRLASPADFLAVAENSGLIVEISDWVLRSAIAAAAAWHRDGWDIRVAVNVSPRQVAAPDFSHRMLQLLDEAGLPPRGIEIELTEQVLQTGERTIETLRELRDRGIGIALDDFGTGYSTLASLEQLPFTRVKLDRSLIARIDTVERSLAIAQTIIDLCRRLDLEITAEGVERLEQLDILARAPGIFVQGYLMSPPLPAETLRREIAILPGRMQALAITRDAGAPGLRRKRAASA